MQYSQQAQQAQEVDKFPFIVRIRIKNPKKHGEILSTMEGEQIMKDTTTEEARKAEMLRKIMEIYNQLTPENKRKADAFAHKLYLEELAEKNT